MWWLHEGRFDECAGRYGELTCYCRGVPVRTDVSALAYVYVCIGCFYIKLSCLIIVMLYHSGANRNKIFSGATPEVVGKLKSAVRNARHVSLLASDPETKSLVQASEAMLALHAAVKVGVLSKMQVCYDMAVQVTSVARLEDDANFSLRKKIVQELAGVRRYMLSIQMMMPLLSNKSQSANIGKSPRSMSPGTPTRSGGQSPMSTIGVNFFGGTPPNAPLSTPRRDIGGAGSLTLARSITPKETSGGKVLVDDADARIQLATLFEAALVSKLGDSLSDAAKLSVAQRSLTIVIKRDGEVKRLLQHLVENKSESFTLPQVLLLLSNWSVDILETNFRYFIVLVCTACGGIRSAEHDGCERPPFGYWGVSTGATGGPQPIAECRSIGQQVPC